MAGSMPRIWALLGAHPGDNNQILALGESLGLPFEIRQLSYNRARHVHPRLLGGTFNSLTRESRALAGDQAPDLTISCGHRSVPVVQALRRSSGGRMRSVHIGYPRLPADRFDLVVTTPEYPVPDHGHVLRLPIPLSRATNDAPAGTDTKLVAGYPRPRKLLVLGGPTLFWRVAVADVIAAVDALVEQARVGDGSLLAVGSPRTPPELLREVERRLATANAPALLAPMTGSPSYRALICGADEIFVTSDSASMIADAVLSKRPVGLVPIRPTLVGRAYQALLSRTGGRMRPRDLRFLWAELGRRGLAGTVAEPRSGDVPDVGALVRARVLELLKR